MSHPRCQHGACEGAATNDGKWCWNHAPRNNPLRRSFINAANGKRRKKKYDRNYGVDGRRGDAVRKMPCLCASTAHRKACEGRVEATHTRARGQGGVKGDARDLVPLCSHHARLAGERGSIPRRGFEKWTGLNLDAEARRIATELDEQLGPEPCYLCKAVGACEPLCKRRRTEGRRHG